MEKWFEDTIYINSSTNTKFNEYWPKVDCIIKSFWNYNQNLSVKKPNTIILQIDFDIKFIPLSKAYQRSLFNSLLKYAARTHTQGV